jgi:hypothetical protein
VDAVKRLVIVAALLLAACAPMLDGGAAAAPAASPRFLLVIHNQDVAADDTASVTFWHASTVDATVEHLVPAGGEAVFDLGASPPDGLQICMTAWAGIPAGPGGNVFGSPDYRGTWIFHVAYPSGFTWKGGPP